MNRKDALKCWAFLLITTLLGCTRKPAPAPVDGASVFNNKCAACHRNDNDMRAPEPSALRQMSRGSILAALETGEMRWEGKTLSKPERVAVASYLGKSEAAISAMSAGLCARDLALPPDAPVWAGWGVDPQNTRFQPASVAQLNREQVKQLKLKWAFGFPGAAATYGQPTSYAGKLFVGSEDGTVYALDAATGCKWWTFRAADTVKTAISLGNGGNTAFFGDTDGYMYAVDANSGSQIWRVRPESHPRSRITGSPLLVGNRLYVPVSSGEEGASADPRYPCCTFRGSVVALDTVSGKRIWTAYTIDQPARPTRKSPQGIQYFGPAGAAVWSSPTADIKRRILYVATGNDYSYPASDSSDAVIAIDMNTGRKLWQRQFSQNDVWNSGCVAPQRDNCPQPRGADYDFGAPPVLKVLSDGRRILLLSQKSGVVYALDPDHRGQLLWKTRIGHGGPLGGIEWGGAVDSRYAFFPTSDYDFDHPLSGAGGLFALDLRSGNNVWFASPPKPSCLGVDGCSAALMAPPTAIPGVVFAGSLDGHLRAYDSRSGQVIWDFNTAQKFTTTNGIQARGGSLNGAGPAIVGGMVFVNSGYTNAIDGNVLLAFAPADSSPVEQPPSETASR